MHDVAIYGEHDSESGAGGKGEGGSEKHVHHWRRMVGSRGAPICSSPRPWTSMASGSVEGRSASVTLFSISLRRRSLIIVDVSLLPSRPRQEEEDEATQLEWW